MKNINSLKFNKKEIKFFSFDHYSYDAESGKALFHYSFDDSIFFTEEIVFTDAPKILSKDKQIALNKILFYLHLALGVSYYKAAIPSKIIVKTGNISQQTSQFFEKLYFNGLQEFAYKNNLSLNIKFSVTTDSQSIPLTIPLKNKAVIPIGGGKDSLVTFDILKSSAIDFCLLHIGNHISAEHLKNFADYHVIHINRKIAKTLLVLNHRGAYNGHIPISSIYAFITLSASVIYDFNSVMMSNERSANVGSIMSDGREVNHQYSKSVAFEKDFSQLVAAEILTTYSYFSLLRPFSELSIAKMFSRLHDAHALFISCNQAFKLENKVESWCLDCPKCRFVFLSLAPFLNKTELISIFNHNLLNDPKQEKGFMALLGIDRAKPFECVGEIEESVAAFCLLFKNPQWSNELIVKKIKGKIDSSEQAQEQLIADVLQPHFQITLIPHQYLTMINDYYRL